MTNRPIKYFDTKVDAEKSVTEIAALIKKYGGTRFETIWDEHGNVTGIRFAMRHKTMGELPVKLAPLTDTIFQRIGGGKRNPRSSLHDDVYQQRLREQAHRIAWRHMKDMTEQILLSVDLGMKQLVHGFMADIEVDIGEAEPIIMADFIERYAKVLPGDRGVRLLPGGKG